MFEVQIEDAKLWKNCVDAIVNLVDEGVLELSASGMSLKAMDPSQIAMVLFTLPKSAFQKYKVEGSAKIGLNFDSLAKIMARTRGKESVLMKADENKLELDFVGEEKRKFKLHLLDVSTSAQKEPKVEFDATVKIGAGAFKEIIKDANLISSHLVIEATPEGFSVDAHGDVADMRAESGKAAQAISELNVKKPARATFPLQYLDDITKACPETNPLTLHLKTNAPIKIEYGIGEASIVYYLAPRIEEE